MGSLDRRIEALEKHYAMGEGPGLEPPDLEERRAAMRDEWQRGWEKAEREAAAGDSRRLDALRELERNMRERLANRGRRS